MGLQNKEVSVSEEGNTLRIRLTEKLNTKNLKPLMIYCYTPTNVFTRDKESILKTVFYNMVEADAIKKAAFYSHEINIVRTDSPPQEWELYIYRDVWGYKVARFKENNLPSAAKQYDADLDSIFEEIG